MSDKNTSSSVGRDELAVLLGASRASDLVAAAIEANKTTSAAAGLTKQSRRHNKRDDDAEDVSKMDRAQAAALVARQFGTGAQSHAARHRAAGKRKRQYQLLAGDYLFESNNNANNVVVGSIEGEGGIFFNEKSTEREEEDKFAITKSKSNGVGRKKLKAKVLLKRGGDVDERRRRRSHSESSSASSSSSSSHSSSSSNESRKQSSRRTRKPRPNSSSSSSSEEDEADLRRKRAREKAERNRSEAIVVSVRGMKGENTNVSSQARVKNLDDASKSTRSDKNENVNDAPMRDKSYYESIGNIKPDKKERVSCKKKKHNSLSSSSSGSSSSDADDSSTSSSSSSSSSSSKDESENNIDPMSASKPLFVPKFKRGTVAEVEAQQQKLEGAEERRMKDKEKRAVQSRALVAEAVSAAGKNGESSRGMDDGDEFETGEVGGEFIPVPDDSDPTDEDSPEMVLAERDAWEVRELIRILRDVDEAVERQKESKELERRRALTDQERLEEDRRSGRYQFPGRRRDDEIRDASKGESNYLQRYHHRGAFYMDEDTLEQAGDDDVRHRAAAYSRAATGEDRVDKRSLPEVLQVKKFGFAGYSTKYKGLAKEDTTDKRLDFLPICGANFAKRNERNNR
jgi:microfibrillar-associated protein 1